MQGRLRLCESLAVSGSLLLGQGNTGSLETILQTAVARNPEMQSAAFRRQSGELVVAAGQHESLWGQTPGDTASDTHISFPISAAGQRWGAAEFTFQPLLHRGLLGLVHDRRNWFVAYLACTSFLAFAWYLGKMLDQRDVAKAIPRRVENALDTLAEGLLVLDMDERIALANRAFGSVVGQSPQSLMGHRVREFPWLQPTRSQADSDYPWTRAIREGQLLQGVPLRLADPAKGQRQFRVNCAPFRDDQGQMRGVLALFEDVTELEETKLAAEAANRAKTEFLANMSHEIRTPMNAVLGFTDVLRRGFEKDPEQTRRHLNTIHSSGEHLLDLINDILDLSKVESGKLELEPLRCSPHKIVADVVAMLEVKAREKGISLRYQPQGPLPETITTDPGRLRQMLMNLTGNAIKFTQHGGVTIGARLVSSPAGPQIAFAVTDTGIGIPPDALAKVFEPFAQADSSVTRRFGGTGLGLAISRRLAEALGGQITVASQLGQGTVFTATVDAGPLDGITTLDSERARNIGLREPAVEHAAQALPPARILIVDDGEENRELLSLVLRQFGVQAESVDNARAAIRLALKCPYDVILMDMQMPVVDGYRAATILRDQGYTQPIIAVTAHAMKSDEHECLAAGCSGFLTKPVEIDKLYWLLAGLLGEAAPRDLQADEITATLAELRGLADPVRDPPPDSSPRPAACLAAERFPAGEDQDRPLISSLPVHKRQFALIVHKFARRLADQLQAMEQARDAGDFAQLAQLAHWLKGSGGNVGFGAFAAPARRLEALAKSRQIDGIGPTICQLQALAARIVLPELDNCLEETTPS